MRRLEGISGKGRYNTQNQMRGLCINNNDNKLFGQLIKLKVLQDGCSLVTKPDFLKDFFFIPYHSGNLYYALKQIKSSAYEKHHEMCLEKSC